MKIDIFVDIRDRIESRELWEELENTGVNVTDLGTNTLVYGTIKMDKLNFILLTCLKFGDAITTITPTHRN